ncbi:MAG: CsbD family protein [Sciscionella sp.]
MGLFDKAKHRAEEMMGKAKETAGNATDSDRLKTEGQADQLSGKAKHGVDDLKDEASGAVQEAKDKLGDDQS